MMNFNEFTENVLKEIRVRAGGEFHIMKQNVVKNNNVKLTGIAVMEEGSIGPCIYLEEFYREYEFDGMRFGEIVDEIYRLLMKHQDDAKGIDISGILNWEAVKGSIYAKLVNAEKNREQLETVPHRIFMDLAVAYYVVVRDRGHEAGTVLVNNGHMEQWGQDEEALYRTAMTNMRADGWAEFASIETVIKRMLPDMDFSFGEGKMQRETAMYILTNRRKCYGASEILDKDTLVAIAGQVGDGFIVLPSSVHETIVLPPRDETGYRMLADMVREVNNSEVIEEERLSYHVYAYSGEEETLKIVA